MPLVDDDFYEGDEELVLELTGADPPGVVLDDDRIRAAGVIIDADPQPHLFIAGPDPLEEVEGGRRDSLTLVTAGTLTFQVRLRDETGTTEAPSATDVSVDVRIKDISTAGSDDYTPADPAASMWSGGSTTLKFDPGVVAIDVVVQTVDDYVGEETETFRLVLENEAGAPLGSTAEAVGTIIDDEVRVSVANVKPYEGDASTPGTLQFQVVLDRAPNADLSLRYELVDPNPSPLLDTAQRGTPPCVLGVDDYLDVDPAPATLTITWPHDPLVAVDLPDVTICGDSVVEPDETLWLSMWVPNGGEAVMEDDGGAFGTIRNDDIPVIIVDDETASEAPAGGTLVFTVRVEVDGSAAVLDEDVTVQYDIVGHSGTGSATAIDDFRAPPPGTLSDTLTFAAGGDTEIEVPVELPADYLPENTETFHLVLSNPSANAELFDRDPNNSIDEPYAMGTIEDDPPPVLSVSGFIGPEDSTQSFTVELDMAPRAGETVTVDYVIAGAGAHPATDPAVGVTLHDYTAASGSLSGMLTFPVGTARRSVDVSLLRDAISEGPETLRLTLSSPSRAVLFDRDPAAGGVQAYGVGTIDDEDPPYLFVGNTSAREGVPLRFTVALCNPIRDQEVTVKYETVERSAKAGLAFMAAADTLSFPAAMAAVPVSEECGAGVTADAKLLPVVVQTLRDRVEESDQEVHLVLSGQTPAASIRLRKSIGVGRIINVSAATVRVNDPTADEGDPLGFAISLVDNDGNPAVITAPVTVFYATADRTATAGADYTPVPATPGPCLPGTAPPGVVTFARNSAVDPSPGRTHSVEVRTCPDTEDEDDETVALVLSLAAGTDNAGLGDTEGIGTIIDVTPGLRIADVTAVEGEPLVFRVSLVDDDGGLTSTSEVVSFTVSTEDGTATGEDDYTEVTDRLEIPVGDSWVDVVVETIGDDRLEPPETVRVVLSAPTGASTDRGVAIGTITEACITIDGDDDPGAIVLYDVRAFEDSGEVVVEASLSRPLCEDTPVEYQFVDGTATRGRDYAGIAGPREVSLPASDTVYRRFGFLGVGLTNDRLEEDDETFTVEVNWASSLPAKFGGKPPGVAVVTIMDDDPLPRLRVGDASAAEGEAMTFEVMLTPASGRTVTVQYRTTDGSAVAGTDYDQGPATPPGTWTTIEFEPDPSSGETPTSATFTVQTHADADDVDETFWVELRALDPADPDFVPVNAQIDDGVAVGTILEGDLPEMRISDASGYEGEDLAFVVELSEAASQPVTVSYETVSRPAGPRSATAGVDYTPPAAGASLTFGVGDPLTQTVYVAARDDGVEPEADETFVVELSGVVGASLADPSAVGTINGDLSCIDAEDPGADPPGWTPADPISAPEDAGPMIVSFELDMPYCQSTSFRYVTNGSQSTATNGVDYEHRNRRASVEGLQAVVSFEVPLIDDDINEDDETIIGQVRELGLNPVKIDGDFFLTGTIIDDDSEVAVSVNDVDTDEGDYLTFTVRLDRPSDRAVTVAYATESGPVPSAAAAAAAADYTPADSTVTIPAGELSAPVRVRTLQDLLDEADETVGLRLRNPQIGWSPPQAAVFAPGGDLGVGTITDDDVPPSLRVSDASVDEGGALVFVVTLDAPSGREVSVPVATRDGPARAADGDYVGLASSVVVFAPGMTRQTVSVQTLADSVVESAEVVWLDLGPVGDGTATIGDVTGRGVIRDVSDRRLSVSDASVVEGGTLAFEVGFAEGPSSRDVTVRYETRAGTAAAGDDYDDGFEAASRELRIVAGDTSATVSVPTVPDTLNEDNESLELVLSDPAGAVIVAGSASGTIIDDDPLPELRVSNTAVSEGVGASAVFTLSLGEASGRDVTVAYSTADLTADAGDDYIAVSDGEVVIAAGDRQATVDVALVDDDVVEDVETFRLVVSSAVNASRGDSVGVATVTDDDGLVQILVDDPAAVHEGDGASAVFTVRLSHAHPTEAVTVVYSTADGTAIAGDDYTNTSDTLTFAAGRMDETVSVPLINDDDAEEAETFRLVLSSPGSNAELGDGEATVLIRDDDGLPTVSVADAATRTEGATATFTVTLSRAVPREVTVDYATRADPTAAAETAAVPGQDYTAASGTVTFAARATEATVTVPLLGDALDEHTETFWLRLASPVGATIVDDTATGTIADDDPLPEITITDAGATEGTPLSFEVRLTPFSGRTVTVPWTTEARPPGAGAASPGSDYTAASGTLTLAPGTTTARVEVATLPDDVSEADETFLVHLGTPANAALDDSTAVGAIFDDDGVPRVFIADTTVNEDAGPAIFTVTLSHPSSQPVTVGYNTADGTAEDPDDYAPDLVRTLTIPATFTAGEISVFIADDDLTEGTETFTITLTDPVNAVIAEGAGTAVGYIVDDEGQPRLSVSDAEECEDGSSTADCEVRICRIIFPRPIEQLSACAAMLLLPGACQPGMCTGDGTLEFSVQLSHASSEETSVRYTIFERGAVDPRDYVASSGTLRIPAGDVSAAIPVVLVDDAIDEEEVETFLLRLDDPVGVELVVAEAVGTILDDDLPPRVAAEPFDAFSNENDGFAYHRVTLSDPSDLTATMDYVFEAVDDRSEFAGIDPTPGTLTFAPGVVQQTIEVPLIDNSVATFTHGDGVSWRHATTLYRLNLNNRVNARTGIDTSLGVVWDDETSVYVESVAAQDILEGAGAATFTIALNRFSDTAVTATYQTVDGTAAAGIDYTAAEATVTFPPGTITATVTVAIIDDTDIENDESFTLRIIDDARNSNLTYLAQPLSDGHGTGFGSVLIIDDDSMPEVSVAGTRANENAGTMTLWVSLSRASATAVTVDFATADGTATAGSDYTATNGTLTIPAGATGAGVSVTILDDTADTESDETFTLNLSNAAGATIADADATATIIEDANLPTLTMGDASQTENIVLESPFIGFRPRIDSQATRTITVDWQVVEVPSLGDEAATIGADFLASPSSGTFTILPRPTTQRPVPVFRIVPDVIPERDERFQVILSNPRGARLGNTRVWGTIRNDDVPIVSVADVEASESDGAVVFTLQLHEPGLDPASLDYTTMVRPSEGDRAASPGDDYTTAWGTLNIPAGDTTATITVPILADSVDEADETFLLVLTNPDTLEFRDSTAVGTITDDDPGWVIDDRSVREDAGSMVFRVQRDHTSPADVAVEYRFGSGGSAVGGADCAVDGVDFVWPSGTSATGTVTMPAAGTEAAVSVEVCNDDDAEGRENLLIELTNVTGRKLTGVGTIVDDD